MVWAGLKWLSMKLNWLHYKSTALEKHRWHQPPVLTQADRGTSIYLVGQTLWFGLVCCCFAYDIRDSGTEKKTWYIQGSKHWILSNLTLSMNGVKRRVLLINSLNSLQNSALYGKLQKYLKRPTSRVHLHVLTMKCNSNVLSYNIFVK